MNLKGLKWPLLFPQYCDIYFIFLNSGSYTYLRMCITVKKKKFLAISLVFQMAKGHPDFT